MDENKTSARETSGYKSDGTLFVEKGERSEEDKNVKSQARELSPNFTFKLIMLGIFLAFTIYFLYLLIRIFTR